MKNTDPRKLMIFADDMTGALDSGVQLAKKGRKVTVFTGIGSPDLLRVTEDVTVINTESRHLRSEEACKKLFELTSAFRNPELDIYKKTDSGLRGNVGAELTAVLDASGQAHINFVPAYPAMRRTVREGILYIDGVPVSESSFGRDAIDPVSCDRVEDVIHTQCSTRVCTPEDPDGRGIRIFDGASDSDLRAIYDRLQKADDLNLCAGCAGFLNAFPESAGKSSFVCHPEHKMLILSGSLSDATIKQLAYAENHGAERLHIPLEKLADPENRSSEIKRFTELAAAADKAGPEILILDTLCQNGVSTGKLAAETVAEICGELGRELFLAFPGRTFFIIGGDTAQGFIQAMGIPEISPQKELTPGTVLSSFGSDEKHRILITKSGGFGTEDEILKIQRGIKNECTDLS